MKNGVFITLEGCEGVGKSTNGEYVKSFLEEQSIDVVMTREPGGTELGEQIRTLLIQENTISAKAELLMIFAARAQHVEEVIIPALNSGKWVVSDRFTDASYAYQGAGRGIAYQHIKYLENFALDALKPELTFLFELPIKIGLERIKKRGKLDRFERADEAFFERANQAYLDLAKQEPERFVIINAEQSVESIQVELKTSLIEVVQAWQQ